jgi:hypothetical protein
MDLDINMTLEWQGRLQTGRAIRINGSETSDIYSFDNQWTALDIHTLPKRLIIKVVSDLENVGLVANEKKSLEKLRDLQGDLAPQMFEQVKVVGLEDSAVVMEFLEGQNLWVLSSTSDFSK